MAGILTGCVTSGHKIEQTSIDKIKKGETTREQVINLLGSPNMMTPGADGGVVFAYMHLRVTPKATTFIPIVGMIAGGSNMKDETLMVTFGADGLVRDITMMTTTTETKFGL